MTLTKGVLKVGTVCRRMMKVDSKSQGVNMLRNVKDEKDEGPSTTADVETLASRLDIALAEPVAPHMMEGLTGFAMRQIAQYVTLGHSVLGSMRSLARVDPPRCAYEYASFRHDPHADDRPVRSPTRWSSQLRSVGVRHRR
jgi:hypothetical protein